MALLPARAGIAGVDLQLEPVDRQHVRVTLTNQGDQSLRFLRWGSPFEVTLTADLFRLRAIATNQIAPFSGRYIKRIDPLPEDFIELATGATIEAVIPLAQSYRLPASGAYEIQLSWAMHRGTDRLFSQQPVLSSVLVAELIAPPRAIAALPPQVNACSEVEQDFVRQAVTSAEALVIEARDGLAGLTEDGRYNSPRYKQWFGEYAPERFERVLNTYRNLIEVLNTETVQLSCDCDRAGWYAFVYPSREYNIYLCPAFWRAPLLGRDSQAGTLIHELTHFPSIGGTADHAYSTEAANLAPALAVDNADNYEYFAENVPALPIFNGVEFTWLDPGVEVSGDLSAGQSRFYKVTGADVIDLFSDLGDADLLLYDSAAAETAVCSRLTGDFAERCTADRDVVTYIEVQAATEVSYRLLADTSPLVLVQAEEGEDAEGAPAPSIDTDDSTGTSSTPDEEGGGAVQFSFLLLCFSLLRLRRRLPLTHG
jgi:peptidyl-Lys metalloendopeptidase